MIDQQSLLLVSAVPIALASMLPFVNRREHTVELAARLDRKFQGVLCDLASSDEWGDMTDQQAWQHLIAAGGKRHMLEQARILLAVTIAESKQHGDTAAVAEMEASLRALALLARRSWKSVFMPHAYAHSCVSIFAGMCSLWETLEVSGTCPQMR